MDNAHTAVTQADIYNAAVQWCGEKDRETSLDDIRYFQANWSSLPGLRRRVETLARHREATTADLQARLDAAEARVAELVEGVRKIAYLRPAGDIHAARNARALVGQMEVIALQALTTTRNADAQGGGV